MSSGTRAINFSVGVKNAKTAVFYAPWRGGGGGGRKKKKKKFWGGGGGGGFFVGE